MARQTTKGKCLFCSEEFSGTVMGRHLKTCKAKTNHSEKYGTEPADNYNNIFLIKVFSPERPEYWLFIEAIGTATLKQLDAFLRTTWLECCGHLSCFNINGVHYYNDNESVRELGGRAMTAPINSVLKTGMIFEHEYDFGTTTELSLKVFALRTGKMEKDIIHLLARNDPPEFTCPMCKKKATDICAMCMGQQEAFFCKQCITKHDCVEDEWDEAYDLPIVNSPRSGLCGYTG